MGPLSIEDKIVFYYDKMTIDFSTHYLKHYKAFSNKYYRINASIRKYKNLNLYKAKQFQRWYANKIRTIYFTVDKRGNRKTAAPQKGAKLEKIKIPNIDMRIFQLFNRYTLSYFSVKRNKLYYNNKEIILSNALLDLAPHFGYMTLIKADIIKSAENYTIYKIIDINDNVWYCAKSNTTISSLCRNKSSVVRSLKNRIVNKACSGC